MKSDAKKRRTVNVAARQLNELDIARFVVVDEESIKVHLSLVAWRFDRRAEYRVHLSATRSESDGADTYKRFDGEFDHAGKCILSATAARC